MRGFKSTGNICQFGKVRFQIQNKTERFINNKKLDIIWK
jgi:hypothetical protein